MKTGSERSRAYRERRKLERPPKAPPKTNKQRCKEYRERVKALKAFQGVTKREEKLEDRELVVAEGLENHQAAVVPRMNEEGPRRSLRQWKDNKERCREYRARLKTLRAQMTETSRNSEIQLNVGGSSPGDQPSTDDLPLVEQVQQELESESNPQGQPLDDTADDNDGDCADLDRVDEPYLKVRWKGLRDTFRCEMKKDIIYRRTKNSKSCPTWRHYKDLLFLKEQMLPSPPIWDPPRPSTRDKSSDPPTLAYRPFTTLKKRIEKMKTIRTAVPPPVETPEDNVEEVNFVSVKEEPGFMAEDVQASDVVQVNIEENFPENLTNCEEADVIESLGANPQQNASSESANRTSLINPLEMNGQLDDNYHFLMSLLPHIQKLCGERQMLLRMQIQELVYKEVYKK
ncbi:uncharacterized protein [Fopius arisanus]|uniref:BESS domain-containing protein n=1 Tax=Fopius arisanus TaxID=64838 RepID=A0A9R1U7Y6_9HYME|nr:PREDICTED: uncharacterized protein LOC105272102 [Fopius arisanus]